jgi:ABC-type histidine transport system ATPase subunit
MRDLAKEGRIMLVVTREIRFAADVMVAGNIVESGKILTSPGCIACACPRTRC